MGQPHRAFDVIGAVALVLLVGRPADGADRDLATSDASFLGEAAGDQAGYALTMCGDVDGDGFDDLLVAAPFNDDVGADAGKVYLVLGEWLGWGTGVSLADADASLTGSAAGDEAGASLGSGDINADGYDDVVIGAPGNDAGYNQSGTVYLLYGSAQVDGADLSLDAADAWITAGAGGVGSLGAAVAVSPDIDGDGIDDLVLGAPSSTVAADSDGQVFVFYGSTQQWLGLLDVESADASFAGESELSMAGEALSAGGDLDGDGLADLLVGAPRYPYGDQTGKTYLLGSSTTSYLYGAGLGASSASFVGEDALDKAGASLAMLGDVDGDLLGDFLVGAHGNAEAGGQGAGKVYLLLGASGPWAPDQTIAVADTSFVPVESDTKLGWDVAGGGDVNGDGLTDFLLGAPTEVANTDPGWAHLFLGRSAGWGTSSSVQNADTRFVGEGASDVAGAVLALDGDLNGDGIDDVVISAHANDDAGVDAGKVYVVLGEACLGTDADGDGWTDCEGDCDDGDAALGPEDADGDGFTPCGGDCDDSDDTIHPGAPEICDGIWDNDCDGFTLTWDMDSDGDGWTSCQGDCDDTDDTLYPEDRDGDGVEACDDDCDDTDPTTHPGAAEVCDGADNDCDGELPADETDDDQDGWASCEGDCDDSSPAAHPDADEVCDGIDNDCDGTTDDVDADQDGFLHQDCGGADCDDQDDAVHPDADELCDDSVDNDCDGGVDGEDTDCVDGDDDTTTEDDDDDVVADDDTAPAQQQGCGCGQAAGTSTSLRSAAGWGMLVLLALWLARSRGAAG